MREERSEEPILGQAAIIFRGGSRAWLMSKGRRPPRGCTHIRHAVSEDQQFFVDVSREAPIM
jgi:hypothetical protein